MVASSSHLLQNPFLSSYSKLLRIRHQTYNSLSNIWKCQRIITRNYVPFMHVRNWHKQPIHVTWRKPEIGWTKLNFDGSCKGKTGKASVGGVLRNHEAVFLLGYAESIGHAKSTVAELVALRRGLELVLENGWSDHVWLEGDSKSLVDIIAKRRIVKCEEAQMHVSHINSMMPELRNCLLTHVYREGNRVADKLAQMGHHFKKPKVWLDVPPNQVLRIVHEDAQGKCFIRNR